MLAKGPLLLASWLTQAAQFFCKARSRLCSTNRDIRQCTRNACRALLQARSTSCGRKLYDVLVRSSVLCRNVNCDGPALTCMLIRNFALSCDRSEPVSVLQLVLSTARQQDFTQGRTDLHNHFICQHSFDRCRNFAYFTKLGLNQA